MKSFFDKFKMLKKDLSRFDWNVRVSDEDRNERLDICNACENFNTNTKFCNGCGCHIPSKSLFYFSECPLDKWPVKEKNA